MEVRPAWWRVASPRKAALHPRRVVKRRSDRTPLSSSKRFVVGGLTPADVTGPYGPPRAKCVASTTKELEQWRHMVNWAPKMWVILDNLQAMGVQGNDGLTAVASKTNLMPFLPLGFEWNLAAHTQLRRALDQ
jgi:hypothetical protein